MTDHRIDDLVREINAQTFSETAHGQGHRVVYSPKETRLYRKGLLDRLIGANGGSQYFVKHFQVPKEVKGWTFRWSEGTSSLSLDFESSFVIQANEDVQALKLVEAIAEGKNAPGEVLYGLINASLHRELERLLRACSDEARSLLDCFRTSAIGIGESEQLNSKVSADVSHSLGNVYFRIGFQLQNSPPTQIEVSQEDEFDLKDSHIKRRATTKALLKLANYQAYKRSGRESEADIRKALQVAITRSVKDLLWGRPYYEVVRAFRNGENCLESQMKCRVIAEAKSIGYSVTMFQSLPDIAALDLLDWKRIDIPANSENYALKNLSSDVQVELALLVRAHESFSNLHLLVEPDHTDALVPIIKRVKQICRDQLKSFTWQEFNLEFEAKIEPALRAAITTHLGKCGVVTDIIRIAQAPTEDASRFKALRGRTTDFELVVTAQGDAGDADAVAFRGTIDVVGMPLLGWGSFEAKDFGFRDNTRMTEPRMRQEAQKRELVVSETSPLPEVERQALAIDLELLEIRDRVVNTLREVMSKVKSLVANWRTVEASRHLITEAERVATAAIEREFGLCIALRGVVRDDSISEGSAMLRLQKANIMARKLLEQDVERESELNEVRGKHDVAMVTNAGFKELEALDNEEHPRHKEARDEAQRQRAMSPNTPRLTADSVSQLLNRSAAPAQTPAFPKLSPPEGDGGQGAAAP